MSRRRPGVLAVGVALAVLLSGCAQLLPGVGGGATSPGAVAPSGSGSPAAASPTPTDLVAARKAAGIADCPPHSDAPAASGGLPDITLECLGGGSGVRLAGLRGPMLVNLWAQWCEPCQVEAPHLAAFASGQKQVAVLGIDYSDPQPELAIQFAQQVGATYPQLSDLDNRLRGPLGVTGIPYTLLIDADGRVVARHPGLFVSLENLQSWVARGLGG